MPLKAINFFQPRGRVEEPGKVFDVSNEPKIARTRRHLAVYTLDISN